MGGECYHYVRAVGSALMSTVTATEQAVDVELAKQAYKDVILPKLLAAVTAWKAKERIDEIEKVDDDAGADEGDRLRLASSHAWQVEADSSTGIRISVGTASHGRDFHSDIIVCPPTLDGSLRVGWQHRCLDPDVSASYGISEDPKHSIAETLMQILLQESPQVLRLLITNQHNGPSQCKKA
eukprot:4355135-Pyramimonas_sp.AAC.2